MPDNIQRLVRLNGKIEGPYSLNVLRAKILDGSIPETSEFQEGESEPWRPIRDLFDRLFPSWR